MKMFRVVLMLAVWLAANAAANAQEARCIPAGVGDRALQCTDGRGHSWYADINGVPSGAQQRQPIVYANPFGAAAEGRRAAMEDAVRLQQLRQQQEEDSRLRKQFADSQFRVDGAQCASAGNRAYADEASQMAYYDLCMAQHGWHKPGNSR
jgi:hypothetical protein